MEKTPKNIKPRAKKGGASMPQGAARYIPTSSEHMAILEERALKKSQPSRRCKAKNPTELDEAGSLTQPAQASKPKKQDKGKCAPGKSGKSSK